jgi:hypothetical protein
MMARPKVQPVAANQGGWLGGLWRRLRGAA